MRRAGIGAGLAIAVVVTALAIGGARSSHAADPGEIDGDLPAGGGFAIVSWGGGSIAQLEAAAAGGGCDVRSTWVFIGGRGIGYVSGAPAFVNAAFLEHYPGGEIPALNLLLVCRSPAAPLSPVAFAPALGGRTFDRPVELVPYPGGRFLVPEQGGRVWLLNAQGQDERILLQLSARRQGNEEGLLSVALDPQFASNRHVWVYYSVATGERRTRLARFTVENDAAVPGSELSVLEVPQPFSNHNGGAIRFGPDGMLYLGLGDGGSGGDPQGHGQNTSTLLGSIIRIDLRNATSAQLYTIPSDNPFATGGRRGEIWAYGLRNPWRMAFDAPTGELWVGDVGQSAVEEIDVITRGANYGWNRIEGDRCYQPGCSFEGTVLPVATYGHNLGCSVTGGVISRDPAVPQTLGAYLFADFCTGRVWAMDAASRGDPVEVGRVAGNPTSFALGPGGEVYIVQFGGPVLRIVGP